MKRTEPHRKPLSRFCFSLFFLVQTGSRVQETPFPSLVAAVSRPLMKVKPRCQSRCESQGSMQNGIVFPPYLPSNRETEVGTEDGPLGAVLVRINSFSFMYCRAPPSSFATTDRRIRERANLVSHIFQAAGTTAAAAMNRSTVAAAASMHSVGFLMVAKGEAQGWYHLRRIYTVPRLAGTGAEGPTCPRCSSPLPSPSQIMRKLSFSTIIRKLFHIQTDLLLI